MKRFEKYIDTILDSETPMCDICKERLGYNPCEEEESQISARACDLNIIKNKEWLKEEIIENTISEKVMYKLSIIELMLLKEWKLNSIEYLSFWSDHVSGLLCDNQIVLLNCIEESELFKNILNDTYERYGNDFVDIDEILDNYELINSEKFITKWYKDEDFIQAYNASGVKAESFTKALNAMKNNFDGVLKNQLKDD